MDMMLVMLLLSGSIDCRSHNTIAHKQNELYLVMMFRKHLSVLLLLFISAFVKAQLKPVAESPVFNEPEHGNVSLLLFKNGGTAYVHITPKDGINIRLYDAAHKEIAVKNINPDYGKLKHMEVNGMFDINDELLLFIAEISDKVPSLYRLRIDKRTADLKELKTIATLKDVNMGQAYASTFGNVPMPSFLVRRDKLSDHYGIVRFNTFESDRNQRVELIQFAADGTETGRVFLSSPEGKYKYTDIFDFLIIGEDAYALLYSYNTPASGGAANELLLAKIKNGTVTYSNVGKALARRIVHGRLLYNNTTGNMVFTTLERINSTMKGLNRYTENYNVSINVVDATSQTVKKVIPLQQNSLLAKFRKLFKGEDFSLGYDGVQMNDDGTFTLQLEYTLIVTRIQRAGTRTTVSLGPSGTITYDEEGNETNTALVPKSQTLANVMFSGSVAGSSTLNGGNQFKGAYFLKMKNKAYVLINDVKENSDRLAKGKLTDIKGLSDCEGWQYELSTTVSPALPVPERTLLFPKAKEKDRNLVLFGASDMDFSQNLFVTLKIGKDGARVMWMSE